MWTAVPSIFTTCESFFFFFFFLKGWIYLTNFYFWKQREKRYSVQSQQLCFRKSCGLRSNISLSNGTMSIKASLTSKEMDFHYLLFIYFPALWLMLMNVPLSFWGLHDLPAHVRFLHRSGFLLQSNDSRFTSLQTALPLFGSPCDGPGTCTVSNSDNHPAWDRHPWPCKNKQIQTMDT